MKAKLLKRLRKRFYWYKDKQNCWYFYDLKTNEVEYAYISGMKSINDMLIKKLLERIGLDWLHEPRYKIVEKRKQKRELLERKLHFSQFFKR